MVVKWAFGIFCGLFTLAALWVSVEVSKYIREDFNGFEDPHNRKLMIYLIFMTIAGAALTTLIFTKWVF